MFKFSEWPQLHVALQITKCSSNCQVFIRLQSFSQTAKSLSDRKVLARLRSLFRLQSLFRMQCLFNCFSWGASAKKAKSSRSDFWEGFDKLLWFLLDTKWFSYHCYLILSCYWKEPLVIYDEEPTADGCSIGSMSGGVAFDLKAPEHLSETLNMIEEALRLVILTTDQANLYVLVFSYG